VYDDDDEEEAGDRDQAHATQFGRHYSHPVGNSPGTPAFTYPDGTSFDPSRGLTQSMLPPITSLPSGDMSMNYLMGATSFSSQLTFQSPTDCRHGPLPDMEPPQFGDRPAMKSYPPTGTGTTYSSLNPPGGNLLRATSLPPPGPIYHPAPHVEMPRRNTTGGAPIGRHQHPHPHLQYGGGAMVPHPPMPDFSSMH
jgi:hypothetical protein